MLKGTKLAIVLDRDVNPDVPNFLSHHKECSGLKIDFLPIKSLEKYLRDNLFLKVDNTLFAQLDNYVFQKRPLDEVLRTYKRDITKKDYDGKILYGYLLNELKSMRKDRDDLIEIVVKHILLFEKSNVQKINGLLAIKNQ